MRRRMAAMLAIRHHSAVCGIAELHYCCAPVLFQDYADEIVDLQYLVSQYPAAEPRHFRGDPPALPARQQAGKLARGGAGSLVSAESSALRPVRQLCQGARGGSPAWHRGDAS